MPGGSGSRGGKTKGSGAKNPGLGGQGLEKAAEPYNEQLLWIVDKVAYARINGAKAANAGRDVGTRGGTSSLFELPKCFMGMGVLIGVPQSSISAKSGAKLRINAGGLGDILVHIKWIDKNPSWADAWRSSGNEQHERVSMSSFLQKIAARNRPAAATGVAQTGYDAKAMADAKASAPAAAGNPSPSAAAAAHATANAAAPRTVSVSLLHLPVPSHPTAAAAAHAAANAAALPPPAPASTAVANAPQPYPSVAAAAHAAAAPQPLPPTLTVRIGF
jgi:hypothetical protein